MQNRLTPIIAAFALAAGAPAGAEETPTFASDVAPILYEECASCHRPGDIAPMSLLTYPEVRPWSRAIKDKVVSREMPPWHAAPGGVAIRNSRGLSQAEIDTIVAWVDGGAPLGDAARMPPLPGAAEAPRRAGATGRSRARRSRTSRRPGRR